MLKILSTAPRKMYFPRSPPIIVHRRRLFVTMSSSQGRIRRTSILMSGSGSDSFLVLKMKKTLAEAHAKLKTLMGMEKY